MSETPYVLGTNDEEIERLGLQHRVWLPRAKAAWQRAGFKRGQTLLDVGCGPGYATLDLAAVTGPTGQVIGLDKSSRFLDVLKARAAHYGVTNVTTQEMDLDDGAWPELQVDGIWARWLFAFVKQPRTLLGKVVGSLKPGGSLVFHEYFDYCTWRLTPPCPELEEFVQLIVKSWRKSGGEPDIGLELPRWLGELGFETTLTTHVDVVLTGSDIWKWPASFVHSGLKRLVELGEIPDQKGEAMWRAFQRAEIIAKR
jgi:SAM-dependent methyltransferase